MPYVPSLLFTSRVTLVHPLSSVARLLLIPGEIPRRASRLKDTTAPITNCYRAPADGDRSVGRKRCAEVRPKVHFWRGFTHGECQHAGGTGGSHGPSC